MDTKSGTTLSAKAPWSYNKQEVPSFIINKFHTVPAQLISHQDHQTNSGPLGDQSAIGTKVDHNSYNGDEDNGNPNFALVSEKWGVSRDHS